MSLLTIAPDCLLFLSRKLSTRDILNFSFVCKGLRRLFEERESLFFLFRTPSPLVSAVKNYDRTPKKRSIPLFINDSATRCLDLPTRRVGVNKTVNIIQRSVAGSQEENILFHFTTTFRGENFNHAFKIVWRVITPEMNIPRWFQGITRFCALCSDDKIISHLLWKSVNQTAKILAKLAKLKGRSNLKFTRVEVTTS